MRAGPLLCCLLLGATACESDSLLNGPADPRIRLDAGGGAARDAAPRDAQTTLTDAGSGEDAAGEDGGRNRDAEPADSTVPECVCPTLPATCAPPAELMPAFGEPMLAQLFDTIACAETSLHVAIYQTSYACIVDALLAKLAADSDVTIDLVIDDDQCSRITGTLDCDLARLDGQPRVRIVDDARSRYMHHKLVIADGREVWVSSANFTKSSFCSEDNNALVVREPAIVQGYETEFQRMFGAGEFGPVDPRAPIEGGGVSLYFSPESPVTSGPRWFADLVRATETASSSVDFMIFALTRYEVANAIVAAHMRGIQVRGLIAPEFRDELAIETLLTAQVPLRVAPVHSKVMIIDGHQVITGSPNWSENAWGNNEASLWIDSSSVAAAFTTELDRIWAGASPP